MSKKISLWINPIKTGLIAGAIMLGFILLIDFSSSGFGLKFLKYLSLAAVLGVGLHHYKKQMQDQRLFFKQSIIYGLTAVATASITLLLGHFLTLPLTDLSIATFSASLEPTGTQTVATLAFLPIMTSAMLFFESLILGSLVLIALLVYMKTFGRTP